MEKQNNELEEMRQQMAILKEKLNAQELVSDRLLRESMLGKMSFMKKYTWVSYFLLAFVCVVYYWMCSALHLSWWLYAFTLVIMTADVACDAYINRFSKEQFMTGDLLETSRRMVWMKQMRKRSLMVSLPMLAIWIAWMGAELYAGLNDSSDEFVRVMCSGAIIGGIIGGVGGGMVGLYIYWKMQRINTEIIRQIEELTAEDGQGQE